jgi:2-polyprenyl-3-methyl-5-hydroxy-6-metoxy-1,4-benzoquinol methylase
MPPGVRIVCWDAACTEERLGTLSRPASRAIELVGERPRQTFSLVLLLDVLEHVEDDEELL